MTSLFFITLPQLQIWCTKLCVFQVESTFDCASGILPECLIDFYLDMTPLPTSTSHLFHVMFMCYFHCILYMYHFQLFNITQREGNWWRSSSKLILWKGNASVVYNLYLVHGAKVQEVSGLEATQEEWLDSDEEWGKTGMVALSCSGYVYNYSISWLFTALFLVCNAALE